MVTGCVTELGNDLSMAVVVQCRWNPGVQKGNSLKIEIPDSSFCPRDSYTVKRTLFLSKIYIRLSLGPSAELFPLLWASYWIVFCEVPVMF